MIPKPAVSPIKPTLAVQKRLQRCVTSFSWLGRWFLKFYISKVIISGKEHLTGPALVMMNHTNVFDHLVLSFYAGKPIHFLVTEPFMSDRFIARLFAWLGQIPKRKLDADTRSIRTMKQWCQLGGLVALFPEGGFSWDGYPLPLRPGLQQLVTYLDVPVIIVRVINGDRFSPPWAKNLRRTSLRIEIDPPKKFMPGEPIEEYVVNHLAVNPDTCQRWPSSGKNLAEGLAKFLRFCPVCGGDNTLSDRGDRLRCTYPTCLSSWQVTSDNFLRSQNGEIFNISKVLQLVYGHIEHHQGAFHSLGSVDVLDCSQAQWSHLSSGFLELNKTQLNVGAWHLDLHELLDRTHDWGHLILLRTARQRIAIRMPNDSRVIWSFIMKERMQ